MKILPTDRSFIEHLNGTTPEARKRKVVSDLRQELQRWCRENGGEYGTEAGFAAAAREHVNRLSKQHGIIFTADPATCTTKDHSILAAYNTIGAVGLESADVSFYDAASAQAFMASLKLLVQARKEEDAARLRADIAAAADQARADETDDPHPEQEARRTEVAAAIAQVMGREQLGLGARFEYLGHCRVRVTTDGPPNTLSLRFLDHASLANVEWSDTPVLGVIYRIIIGDRSAQKGERLYMGSIDAAQQVVSVLENLGRSCGAF
ncbi:hypothetical protein [Sorangium atrum]|uniref:Uncharacterized protein n=1 Tax=Sorangium atrum TaxID=2995308 RepID=A0ABT5BWC9_9BACT|nr:hypothetical protein [Sorangium aterium]MDC0678459.1 hypothetical protein [Sorangium aterium]